MIYWHLEVILLSIISFFLFLGSIEDLEKMKVNNVYPFLIGIASIPLILMNNISVINITIIILISVIYKLNAIGGSDVKVLIPIIATIQPFALSAFVFVLLASIFLIMKMKGIEFRNESKIPFYPAILASVMFVIIYIMYISFFI